MGPIGRLGGAVPILGIWPVRKRTIQAPWVGGSAPSSCFSIFRFRRRRALDPKKPKKRKPPQTGLRILLTRFLLRECTVQRKVSTSYGVITYGWGG